MALPANTNEHKQATSGTKKSSFHCCVPNCVSDGRYNSSINFHHFPKDPELRKQWIIKIRRDEGPFFKIANCTVVCSKHFRREDYRAWTPVRKNLKPNVVPSIFDWRNEPQKRRALKRIYSTEYEKEKVEAYDDTPSEEPATKKRMNITEETEGAVDNMMDNTQMKILELEKKLSEKEDECNRLRNELSIEKFGINRFSTDDTMVAFYTGFQTHMSFMAFYRCVQPTAQNMLSAYYRGSETISLSGRKRCMLLVDELFLFLCRLRAGLMEQDLCVRFACSLPTVSRKIVTWANFLYFVLGRIPIWLSKSTIKNLMPDCFKTLYPNTRVIIDCTELKTQQTQQPSSLVFNSQSFSNYKSTNTFKCLLGIAPHGAVTFISPVYTGCMSDVEITKLSGILDLLERGDDIMADKGFTIRKVLSEKGMTLNIPSFLSSKRQFSPSEVYQTEEIAKLRIHIERMNRRIKENHLFDCPIPLSLVGTVNQLWTVACILANFKGPIVKAWSD